MYFLFSFLVVQSQKKDSVLLTCQLSDTSEVTDYEWVHVTYDLNGTKSVGPVQKGKTLSIKATEENRGEWACHFYRKDGILGNVTYHVQLMSKFSCVRLMSSVQISHCAFF